MDNVTSISNLLDTFKYSGVELNNDEQVVLNSIFVEVDKWNKKGKSCSEGDGWLNSKEYYMFSNLLKKAETLYEKFTQTNLYTFNKDRYNLHNLFLDDSVDADFINSLPEQEIQGLVNNISFETDRGEIDKSKAKQLFKIQLQLLKNNNCYTDDLENLVNMLLKDYSNKKFNKIPLESLKNHINCRLAAAKKDNKDIELKEPNGSIDANFKQGYTGDCWLLSTIKALASDEKGLEKLNNMISVQKDDEKVTGVTVHLQGKDYIISREELYSSIEYSTGDLDVRALEIAVNRFCLENSYDDINTGGHSGLGYSILLGDADKVKEFAKMKPQDFYLGNDFMNNLKTGNRVGTIGGAYSNTYAIDVETGEKVKLIGNHEYAITGSDTEFVYLSNPHDSSKKLKLEIDNINNTFAKGLIYDIT